MSEQTKYAGTAAGDGSDGDTWVSTSNATGIEDDSGSFVTLEAAQNPADVSEFLELTNFGFDLPSLATVLGVLAEFRCRSEPSDFGPPIVSRTSSNGETIQIIKAGTKQGDNNGGGNISTSPNYSWQLNPGGNDDTWGLTLVGSDVNASNFGVAIRAECNSTLIPNVTLIDAVRITAYYAQYNEGTNSPGTMAQDSDGDISWTNVNNAKASDNSYATAAWTQTVDEQSNTLKATNFGYSITSDKVIEGIRVEIERKNSIDGIVSDVSVRLIVDGVISGNNYALGGNWTSSDTVVAYGGLDDWGLPSLSVEQVSASDFGVALKIAPDGTSASTSSVDHIKVTVYTKDGLVVPKNSRHNLIGT